MKNLDFKNKKVAVLGMGIEGLALVDFLLSFDCQISVLDKLTAEEINNKLSGGEKEVFKKIIENDKTIKIFGDIYLENLSEYEIIFRSPGISYYNPKIQEAKNAGVEISSQIKLFFDLCPCKIVGVTGTKGKGTTASLIYEILKKNSKHEVRNSKQNQNSNDKNLKPVSDFDIRISDFPQNIYIAGNIGYPAITLIPKLKPEDIVILELSSFQLMDLKKSPQIAVVTNLLIDHLDYHKDETEYRMSKESVIKYQNEDDFAVLNIISTFDSQIINNIKSNVRYFGDNGLDPRVKSKDDKEGGKNDRLNVAVTDASVILDPQNRNIQICKKTDISLFGHHNLENIAAASLVADVLHIDVDTIKDVVKNFKGLPHRLEFVAEIDGIKFINDSFATNPEPTIAAINSFFENKVLILGGSSKGADFSVLAEKIANSNIKAVVLIGDEADKIEKALITSSYSGQITKGITDIDEIVKVAKKEASSGDVVILSPACASFGLFQNYKDRGEKFKNAVQNLKF